jgi:hypothetical protein
MTTIKSPPKITALQPLKLYASKDGDYYMLFTIENNMPKCLFEGHSLAQAYEAVFKEISVYIPREIVEMGDGSYVPTLEKIYE